LRKPSLRGKSAVAQLEGEGYALGEQMQYTDIWANDNYLQFMFERLILLKELLGDGGSIYLHCDTRKNSQLRLLMDEVFGPAGFKNQVSWRRTSAHAGAGQFGQVTDSLLFYRKGNASGSWNRQFQEISAVHRDRHYRHEDADGVYALGELTAPGIRRGDTGEPWRGFNPTSIGRHWARKRSDLDKLDDDGLIHWPEKESGWPRLKKYWKDHKGKSCTDFGMTLTQSTWWGLRRPIIQRKSLKR
jgi:hypothetical protein